MSYTSLENFVNNAEDIINNVISNEEIITIKAEDGNAVLLSETQYHNLVCALIKTKTIN